MKIVTASEYEIFNEYSSEGHLIKKAAYTCYSSEEKSNKSTEQMIELLKNNKHNAMLEFSWYPILIRPVSGDILDAILFILKRFEKEKFLNCTITPDRGVLISGNGRAWYECLIKDNTSNTISRSIYNFLNKINPALFDTHDIYSNDSLSIQLLTKEQIQLKEKTLNEIPILQDNIDRDKHDWFAVKFYGVSRGMTHELVRHRVMSYAQKSSRYVPMMNFNCMFGDDPITKNSVDLKKIDDCLNVVQETYNYLIGRGQKRDVARQILPIGITSDIVVAGNVRGWRHLFELRTNEKAHWEIRTIMNDLKRELNEEYNYHF